MWEALLRTANLLKGNSLYDLQNISLVHHINQALRAHKMYRRDTDYIVKADPKDNIEKVIIVDEFTGRICTDVAGRTACIRPSRPRKACRSKKKPRRSRRSPSKIFSTSTKSSPA